MVNVLHHNFASCWMCKMASYWQAACETNSSIGAAEGTHSRSQPRGRKGQNAVSCRNVFLTVSDRRKELSSRYRLCNIKLFLKHTHILIKQFGQPYGHGLRQNDKNGGTGMHQGIKWMNSSLFSHAVFLLGKYLQTGVLLEIFSVPHQGEGFVFVLFRHLCYSS